MCFDLNIEFEDLKGESKQAKVREIVAYCERVGRTDDLVVAIRKQRPKLVLQDSPPITSSSTESYHPSDRVAINLIFNKDGLVIKDERELRASLLEALLAAENQIDVTFDVLIEPLEAVERHISSIESGEATPENRITRVNFLKQARALEEKQKVITAALPLLLLPPIRNHFISVNDLIGSLHGLARQLFESDESVNTFTLDVFRERNPKMNTLIWIDQAEVEQIKASAGLKSIFALVGPGWDLFDLPRETRFRKAIPAIALQVIRMRLQSQDTDKPFDLLKALDWYSWSIGLH